MEPANLNLPPAEDDARFDAWLREPSPAAPLSDAGFSARVLAALPPRCSVIPLRRAIVYMSGALLGTIAARLDSGQWPSLAGLIGAINSEIRAAMTLTLDPWLAVACAVVFMTVIAAGVAAMVLRDDEPVEPQI